MVSPYTIEDWEDLPLEERLKYWAKILGVDSEGNINMPAIIDLGECYTDPGSFCSNCSNLVVKDRYCTQCGKKNKNYNN